METASNSIQKQVKTTTSPGHPIGIETLNIDATRMYANLKIQGKPDFGFTVSKAYGHDQDVSVSVYVPETTHALMKIEAPMRIEEFIFKIHEMEFPNPHVEWDARKRWIFPWAKSFIHAIRELEDSEKFKSREARLIEINDHIKVLEDERRALNMKKSLDYLQSPSVPAEFESIRPTIPEWRL